MNVDSLGSLQHGRQKNSNLAIALAANLNLVGRTTRSSSILPVMGLRSWEAHWQADSQLAFHVISDPIPLGAWSVSWPVDVWLKPQQLFGYAASLMLCVGDFL